MRLDETKETLRQFILATYLPGESPDQLRDDTPLITSSIIDSLGALGLASFVEERFQIELTVHDRSTEQFDRIEDLAALIVSKKQPASSAVR